MPDFLDKLARRAEVKAGRLGGTFTTEAAAAEAELRDLVRGHWHPLPRVGAARRRPALAVDSSIGRADLVNGATLFAAQALALGHGARTGDGIEISRAEVEILPGTVEEGQVKRFNDLLMQSLELAVAREGATLLPDGGVLYMDGALYSRLPQLYPLNIPDVEPLHAQIAADYRTLFAACNRDGRAIDLVCLAKTSRTDLHSRLWQRDAGVSLPVVVSDSEAIYRWTDGQAGFSTPVVLGYIGFSGGNDYVLTETGLTDAPAVVSFFVRLAEWDDAMLVEFPAPCVGHSGTLRNLDADVLDLSQFNVGSILETLAADYGGLEVYNALLYSVDREVRLKRSTLHEIYLRVVGNIVGHDMRLDRSDRRF